MSIVKLNNNGVKNATAFGSISALGSMILIKKLTASSSGTLDFVDGTSSVVLDNTYKEYIFTFKNIHPQTDEVDFLFQGNAAGGSGYNETITSTQINAYHAENGSDAALTYQTTRDQAQGTSFQMLTNKVGNGNDEHTSGYLHLFNPSSTTFVKNFVAHLVDYHYQDYVSDNYTAGYFNTTSAIDEIQFKFSSGNIDAGDICLYGIS
jgi:hypothetical protein